MSETPSRAGVSPVVEHARASVTATMRNCHSVRGVEVMIDWWLTMITSAAQLEVELVQLAVSVYEELYVICATQLCQKV
jgi:hypothetical protein